MNRRQKEYIIIADSGSTKTDWRVIYDGNILDYIVTVGLNPFYQSKEEIISQLKASDLESYFENDTQLFFYGAGCLTGVAHSIMNSALQNCFKSADVEVSDDLMAAARATLGSNKGIACILGTGSNSCLFNGKEIIDRIPAMGFILGDEGSGAVLGRDLVNALFKREMPSDLSLAFMDAHSLKLEDLLQNVYREKFPNRYLAGFTYFLKEHEKHPWIHNFLTKSFGAFLEKNVSKYSGFDHLPVSFTGSVAEQFKDVIEQELLGRKLHCGDFIGKPVDALVKFHLNAKKTV